MHTYIRTCHGQNKCRSVPGLHYVAYFCVHSCMACDTGCTATHSAYLGRCNIFGVVRLVEARNLGYLELHVSVHDNMPNARARGSSGLASVSSEEMDSSTLEMVRAGLHWFFRMSRQMPPVALMLGW